MTPKWVVVKHFCPRGQAFKPSLPHVDKHSFFRTPPPALSPWFMNDPLYGMDFGLVLVTIRECESVAGFLAIIR